MIIKICGLSSIDMAQAAQTSGADLIGFVFAPSKRQVSVEAAKAISKEIKEVGKVGVFVNAPLSEVREIAEAVKLDYVQLHGEEPVDYSKQVGYPVIKAVRVRGKMDIPELNQYPAEYLLLDSFVAGQQGGTGIAFNWEEVKSWRNQIEKPLLVAGGLHKDNVQEAIDILAPQGVDVSGGVETQGRKNKEKIKAFINTVRCFKGE